MQLWKRYKKLVAANMRLGSFDEAGLFYWRNRLFVNIIVYLLPVSMVAVIPGVILSIKGGIPGLAAFDIIGLLLFVLIAFNTRFSIGLRKALLLVSFYTTSVALLVFLGVNGPILIYLFAITIFSTLIFPVFVGYLTIAANTIITIAFAILINKAPANHLLVRFYDRDAWLAVSSNLTFLSILTVTSVNLLFKGLHNTIRNEKEAHDKLARSEQNLKSLINNTTDLIWSLDRNLNFITCNESFIVFAKQYHGCFAETQETLGKWLDIGSVTKWDEYYRKALSGEKFSTDIDFILPAGKRYIANVSFNPIVNGNGEIACIGCFAQEMTQRRMYEEKIQNQNGKLKEIAFLTSHSLRSPMVNIMGLVEILDTENFNNPENKRPIEFIHNSVLNLDKVVHEIVEQTLLIENEEDAELAKTMS